MLDKDISHDRRKHVIDIIEGINDAALDITTLKRFYQNPFSFVLRNALELDKNTEPFEFMQQYNFFTTKKIGSDVDKNIKTYKDNSHKFLIDLLTAEDHLNFNTRQLLEVIYFYNNFPFETYDPAPLQDLIDKTKPRKKNLSEYDKFKLFYNTTVRNYNDSKRERGFTEYFVAIAHMFNMCDKTIELTDNTFESLMKNFYFDLDVPLEQTLDINIGRNKYKLRENRYRTLERLDSETYMKTLDNMAHNVDIVVEYRDKTML